MPNVRAGIGGETINRKIRQRQVREGWVGWGNECLADQPAKVVKPKAQPKAAAKGKAASKKAGAANDAHDKQAA